MVPIASVKIPVVIQTEEVLEKLAAQKAADDAAQKLAIKAAKQAVQLECKQTFFLLSGSTCSGIFGNFVFIF